MEAMLKRQQQNSSSGRKQIERPAEDQSRHSRRQQQRSKQQLPPHAAVRSVPDKCYSADDNFYSFGNQRRHPTAKKSRRQIIQPLLSSAANSASSKQVSTSSSREDVIFKRFLRVFNSNGGNGGAGRGTSSGGGASSARDWLTVSASNVMEFAPKILGRKFCSRKRNGQDNELYRSNSFRFEKYERKDADDSFSVCSKSTISRQISLCDDYSLPIDFVNKRPLSLDSGTFWNTSSPNSEQIEALNLYCDPKYSKGNKSECAGSVPDDLNFYDNPSKEYDRDPYSDCTDNEEEDDVPEVNGGSSCDLFQLPARYVNSDSSTIHKAVISKGKAYTEVRKSPYYYGDLLKKRQNEEEQTFPKERSKSSDAFYRKCSSLDASQSAGEKRMPTQRAHSNASVSDLKSRDRFDIREEDEYLDPQEEEEGEEEDEEEVVVVLEGGRTGEAKAFNFRSTPGSGVDGGALEAEEMATKQRHMYETAFDSKVGGRSTAELLGLDVDAVTNHVLDRCSPQTPHNLCTPCILQQKGSRRMMVVSTATGSGKLESSSIDGLSQNLTDLDLSDQPLLMHTGGYSSASTSTIPQQPQHGTLSSTLNDSLDSFPETTKRASSTVSPCREQRRQSRHKLPPCCRFESRRSIMTQKVIISPSDNMRRPKSYHFPEKVLEIKGRPSAQQRYHKFSSTESMTTNSSSGGSLESIRSSTSEGNRSTTSTDSRHSSSLSSHSSESSSAINGNGYHHGTGGMSIGGGGGRFFNHHSKMHILSPISDKSFQEFSSEANEVLPKSNVAGAGGTSQKASPTVESKPTLASPVTATDPHNNNDSSSSTASKVKRRPPAPNKSLLNLSATVRGVEADSHHHGSDSGISLESRCDMAVNGATTASSGQASSGQLNELQDLPFDMPKLRRRRLQQMQQSSTQDTSSSATSVDLKDLPFDMPKLRRKLRNATLNNSQNSVDDTSEQNDDQENNARFQLNLKLDEQAKNRKSLGLSLNLNELNVGSNPASTVDVTVPLERQGWYHGAITRMEAENELRHHDEGSYLVRNSESAKHDYSLSLKSAKGFMHMRIQKCSDTNKFILGQFSSPFETIPHMIKFYSTNQLPIRGAEHMCLVQPIIAQLL